MESDPPLLEILDKEFQHYCQGLEVDFAEVRINDPSLGRLQLIFPGHTQGSTVKAGCIVKPMTAVLVLQCIDKGLFSLQTHLVELLPLRPSESRRLSALLKGVSVQNLLNHTDGLGNTSIESSFMGRDGWINEKEVLSQIARGGRLFPPGKFYSYGNAGYILLGMVLELTLARPFHEIVRDNLTAPLEISTETNGVPPAGEGGICPSSGKGMTVSAVFLQEFAWRLLSSSNEIWGLDCELFKAAFTTNIAVPGWSNFCEGMGLVLKDFGGGWLGHNGASWNSFVSIRLNLERKAVCVVAARHRQKKNPSALASLIIKDVYPELVRKAFVPPRIVTEPESQAVQLVGDMGRGFCGIGSARRTIG